MPFTNRFVELTHFAPDEDFDAEKDRLEITLDDGSKIIALYADRSDAILNPLHRSLMCWVDHRRTSGEFRQLAEPIPERNHAGYSVVVRRDRRLEFTLISQDYIGGFRVSRGKVVSIIWTRSTTHSTFKFDELIPLELTKYALPPA